MGMFPHNMRRVQLPSSFTHKLILNFLSEAVITTREELRDPGSNFGRLKKGECLCLHIHSHSWCVI